MTLSRARNRIYAIWGVSFVAILLLLELAPLFRRGVIDPKYAHSALLKMAALFTPVLAAFGTFWFRRGERPNNGRVSKERWLPTIMISCIYHFIILLLIVIATYVAPYDQVESGLNFNEWMSNILQVGLFLSPIATAPAAYLLGIEEINVVGPGGTT